MTEAKYQEVFSGQDGRCAICRCEPKPGKALNVDHDHKAGNVRGLLCYYCNHYFIGRRRTEHRALYDAAHRYLAANADHRDVPDEAVKECPKGKQSKVSKPKTAARRSTSSSRKKSPAPQAVSET